ncbi:hypothetical protein N566_05910 [Streptomycetaceae bacterium MP113-05]|nr:hypothetical protein N566_05910 [Streptomycetaceae bacterium MP113-05]
MTVLVELQQPVEYLLTDGRTHGVAAALASVVEPVVETAGLSE